MNSSFNYINGNNKDIDEKLIQLEIAYQLKRIGDILWCGVMKE